MTKLNDVASAQVAHQEDGGGARLRVSERAQVMRRLRVLEASRGVRKSGIPIASRGLPPPEGTSFVNVLFRTTNYRSNRNRPVVVASARETSPGPTARTVSVPGATSVLPASATKQCGRPARGAASRKRRKAFVRRRNNNDHSLAGPGPPLDYGSVGAPRPA